jgi:hypothetical protein
VLIAGVAAALVVSKVLVALGYESESAAIGVRAFIYVAIGTMIGKVLDPR